MTLKEMPKVGDKVRFIGRGDTGYHTGVTVGKIYEITRIGDYGYANFIDDNNDEDYNSYISEDYFECFELVTDDSPRTESDLLANLALRVSELEKTVPHHRHNAMLDFEAIYAELRELKADNHPEFFATPVGNEVGADTTQAERIEAVCNEVRASSLNGKLLRIYSGTDIEGDFHTYVTVGIDEDTGVMYVLGMKTEVVE